MAESETESAAWIQDIIQLKTTANSFHHIHHKTPLYTKNFVFHVNQLTNAPAGAEARGNGSITKRQYSVRAGVDLSTGVVFFSDLKDEGVPRAGNGVKNRRHSSAELIQHQMTHLNVEELFDGHGDGGDAGESLLQGSSMSQALIEPGGDLWSHADTLLIPITSEGLQNDDDLFKIF